jgi:hypothetical protein
MKTRVVFCLWILGGLLAACSAAQTASATPSAIEQVRQMEQTCDR